MPRPRKWRLVCELPERNLYGSLHGARDSRQTLNMTVEEYETIRLIDLEEMTQEQCAEQMGVARTTIQRIYNDARKKLAASLVDGHLLKIGGGDYKLCNGVHQQAGCGRCRRKRFGQTPIEGSNPKQNSEEVKT